MARKKIYFSYRLSGEDPEELRVIIQRIGARIRNFGQNYIFHSPQHNKDLEEIGWSFDKIADYLTKNQAESNIFVALIYKEEQSMKMKVELKKAIELKQHIVLLIKKGLDFQEFRDAANITIDFRDFDTLFNFGFPFS